ncbi:MAG: NAD(+) diphosphatase [Paracoccaceae bacterium]
MRIAETVTFGGSGLDRAAHLRGDPEALAQAMAKGRILALWRGKPLVAGDGLHWLAAGHPVLAGAKPAVFLGLDDQGAMFASDISAWQPVDEVPPGGFFDPSAQPHPDLGDDAAFQDLRALMTRLTPREAELAATAKAVCDWHARHGFCAVCGQPSEPQQGGWQRDCPACEASHFPRTDPVVIMLVTRGNSLLLGRSPGWPEGMYSLLAGFIEPGETVEAAVRREVFEESGIQTGEVRYLASQPWPFPASLMLGCAAEALSDQIKLDPAELDDAVWITREDMVTVLAGAHPTIRPPRKGAIAQFLIVNWLADRLD